MFKWHSGVMACMLLGLEAQLRHSGQGWNHLTHVTDRHDWNLSLILLPSVDTTPKTTDTCFHMHVGHLDYNMCNRLYDGG
jgi:hypothetical protein